MHVTDFLDRADLTPEARGFAAMELSTGCGACGRRLLSSNNAGDYVRPDTAVLTVQDEQTGRDVAAYVLCAECASRMFAG